ncbi:hypothetical protein EGY07_05705 [Chryseobacterium indologenes]|nr:hypothetical protein EGY07_05705 [Chryseobacterium indologenes]
MEKVGYINFSGKTHIILGGIALEIYTMFSSLGKVLFQTAIKSIKNKIVTNRSILDRKFSRSHTILNYSG